MTRDTALDRIASAILDNAPVDWSVAETADTPLDTALVAQFKTLAAVRAMARAALAPAALPRTWGHLRLLELIGAGAHGDVYRAWDTRLDREVALKLLRASGRPEDGPSGSAVIEEGRLLARVRHPNVATIYGAEYLDGRTGLWMELVQGRTLEDAIADGNTFTAADVIRLGAELCRAVAAVHAAGLLHRDIKPQNVMLADEDGRLVLMDFGTGHELNHASGADLAGTPLYLAPEVLAGGPASRQSDVYSIGVVLFRLLTARYPVFAANLASLRDAHGRGGARAVLDHNAIPSRLRRVLARALDPDPARRFDDASALGHALTSASAPSPRWRTATLVAMGVLVTALGGWQLLGPATPTRIVVMPFTSAGPANPGNDFPVDGLTIEVINQLASIEGLAVTSKASSLSLKGRDRDLRHVSQLLGGLDYAIEATVQRAGEQVRINAQFIKAPEDVAVWSKTFEIKAADAFAVQGEIAREIVNHLRLTLGGGQRRYVISAEVNELYLRAREKLFESLQTAPEARQLFERVMAMEPGFTPAYAGWVEAYNVECWTNEGPTQGECLAQMRPAALRALALDPLLPQAHAAMGIVSAVELHWDEAEQHFEKALSLPGDQTDIRVAYSSTTLWPQGHAAKALDVLEVARASDPLSVNVKREIGMELYLAGRYDEAVGVLREVLAVEPASVANVLARSLIFSGRPEEAVALWRSRPWRGDWERWIMPAYVALDRKEDIQRMVEAHVNAIPFRQALIFAALGDKERTFEQLQKAVDSNERPVRLAALLSYPEMKLLHGDPRFDDLRRRFNLR